MKRAKKYPWQVPTYTHQGKTNTMQHLERCSFQERRGAMDTATEKVTPRQRASAETSFCCPLCSPQRRRTAQAVWLASVQRRQKIAQATCDRPMLCRGSKPATMRKRTVRTAGQSITPTKSNGEHPPRRFSNENPSPNGRFGQRTPT